MKLTAEQARDIVWESDEDWQSVEEEVVGNDRWSIHKTGVFKHIPTAKFYRFNWSVGATEYQDEQPYEYDKEVEVAEVELREILVKQWVTKDMLEVI